MRLKDLIKVATIIIATLSFSHISASCKNGIEANNEETTLVLCNT